MWKRSVFAGLSDDELDEFAAAKTLVSYQRGERLFEEGAAAEQLFCIRSGIARVVQHDDFGRAVMVRIATASDTAGHRSIFTRATFCGTTEAATELSACRIPRKTVLRLLSTSHDFSRRMITKMAHDIEATERERTDLFKMNVRERLVILMLNLVTTCGEPQDDRSWRIGVQISKGDIACMLGTAYETAIRFMSEFKRDGILREEGQTVYITDLAKLRAAAPRNAVARSEHDHDQDHVDAPQTKP